MTDGSCRAVLPRLKGNVRVKEEYLLLGPNWSSVSPYQGFLWYLKELISTQELSA